MARDKSKIATAVEWLWSHRGKNIGWSPSVLTEANTRDATAPKVTFIEAVSIFERLGEKGLILLAGEQSPGNPVFMLHESKEGEWNAFILELQNQPQNANPKDHIPTRSEPGEPDLTDPQKFAGHHISKNLPHLKAAWKAVLSVAALSFLGGFLLAWNLVVTSKNAGIEMLQISNADKQSRITELAGENEKLTRQVAELRTYRGQDVLPLKRKALILAQQIRDFIAGWKDADDENTKSNNVHDYLTRFGLRAQIMRDDLDQNGQQSDPFDKVMFNFQSSYQEVRVIAQEIEMLGKKLPD